MARREGLGRLRFGINELDCTINVYAYQKENVLGPILQTVSTLPEGDSGLKNG